MAFRESRARWPSPGPAVWGKRGAEETRPFFLGLSAQAQVQLADQPPALLQKLIVDVEAVVGPRGGGAGRVSPAQGPGASKVAGGASEARGWPKTVGVAGLEPARKGPWPGEGLRFQGPWLPGGGGTCPGARPRLRGPLLRSGQQTFPPSPAGRRPGAGLKRWGSHAGGGSPARRGSSEPSIRDTGFQRAAAEWCWGLGEMRGGGPPKCCGARVARPVAAGPA